MNRDPFGEGGVERERRVERPPTYLNSDPFGEVGRMQNRALQSHRGDSALVFRAILKALTLPFWLPFWILKRYRIRREMIAMGRRWQGHGLSYREMAVRWAERFPQEYPLGEYDPGMSKLEARFRKLLEK